jgi:hypothetical protein
MRIHEVINLYNLISDPDQLAHQEVRKLMQMSPNQFLKLKIIPIVIQHLGTDKYIELTEKDRRQGTDRGDVFDYIEDNDLEFFRRSKFKRVGRAEQPGSNNGIWDIFLYQFKNYREKYPLIGVEIPYKFGANYYLPIPTFNFFKAMLKSRYR